ncbi:MAG: hypothetical protein ABEN55_09255 [Bradymonadaceae bacterium]
MTAMSSDRLGHTFGDASDRDARQRMQFARQCFHSIQSFVEARAQSASGLPHVTAALRDVASALDGYFEHAATLPLLLEADGVADFRTEQLLWESETAREIAERLRSRGVGYLELSSGVEADELHRLLDVLARTADETLTLDPVTDLSFDHIRIEWIDQSSVELTGVGGDIPTDEPTSVTRATHRLFEREFAERFDVDGAEGPSLYQFLVGDLETPVSPPTDTNPPPLPNEASTRTESVQVQRARTFRDLLTDHTDETTRARIAENSAAAVARLIDDSRFDEARQCVTILCDAGVEFAAQLRAGIEDQLDAPRCRRLAELLVVAEPATRQHLLEFAHRLRSSLVTRLFASTLKWDLSEPVARDVIQYLERRSAHEFRQFVDVIDTMTTERAGRLIDAGADGLPQTRPFLQTILGLEIAPPLKIKALDALQNSWEDRDQVLDIVSPLVGTPNASLRGRAIETIAEMAPEAIEELLDPYVGESLARRDPADLDNIVHAYAEYGGSEALRRLEELIRVKRFADEERRQLAVQLVEVLAEVDSVDLRTLFGRIADDWLVASDVRDACKSARNPSPS